MVKLAVGRLFDLDKAPAVVSAQHGPSFELVHVFSSHNGKWHQVLLRS